MANIVENYLKSFLLKKNKKICRTTNGFLIKSFISSLKPVTTNHNLIRVGGDMDGGYLIPDDLHNINTCFSPGVSKVANFELELASRGIKCFLADYSVETPPVQNELFDFEKKYLGITEDPIYITLENWVERKAPNQSDLILQMDIEGAEYGVIYDTSRETLRKFRILVIEFHELDAIIVKVGFDLINLTFSKLLKDFEIVHIHPNNTAKPKKYIGLEIPPTMEFTFLRKDRIFSRQPTQTFPHKLDRPSDPHNENYPLPRCWYE
jgi:hypothetical protein